MLRGVDNDIKGQEKVQTAYVEKRIILRAGLQLFVLALAISPVLNIFHISVLIFPQLAQIMPKVSAYTFLFVVTMQQNE